MNRRKFFKGLAALPFGLLGAKAVAAPVVKPTPADMEAVFKHVIEGFIEDLKHTKGPTLFAPPTGFVPKDIAMYVHRGEQRVRFVLPPGRGSAETQRQIDARNRRLN